jgi:hypothetical protein
MSESERCEICGKAFYGTTHKCDEAAHQRRLTLKETTIRNRVLRRYGHGETFGDKLCAAENIMRMNSGDTSSDDYDNY